MDRSPLNLLLYLLLAGVNMYGVALLVYFVKLKRFLYAFIVFVLFAGTMFTSFALYNSFAKETAQMNELSKKILTKNSLENSTLIDPKDTIYFKRYRVASIGNDTTSYSWKISPNGLTWKACNQKTIDSIFNSSSAFKIIAK